MPSSMSTSEIVAKNVVLAARVNENCLVLQQWQTSTEEASNLWPYLVTSPPQLVSKLCHDVIMAASKHRDHGKFRSGTSRHETQTEDHAKHQCRHCSLSLGVVAWHREVTTTRRSCDYASLDTRLPKSDQFPCSLGQKYYGHKVLDIWLFMWKAAACLEINFSVR